MTSKTRVVYINGTAVPHQIELCNALQMYVDAEFWFYGGVGKTFAWREIPLGEHCRILPHVFFKNGDTRYLAFSHLKMLAAYDPDVVILGGFSVPGNMIAYLWAKRHGKKVIVFTERSRDKNGNLRKYAGCWRLLRWFYRNVDRVMVSAPDVKEQFANEFRFGDRVIVGQYANLIDGYFQHRIRAVRPDLRFIFPNRLTDIYNPLMAIEIFNKALSFIPQAILTMNAVGELRQECEALILSLNLSDRVFFLDHLKAWSDLDAVYAGSDIMIFPAKFSNGNLTIHDAMASGMGIILSNKILGVEGVFEHGETGFICNLDADEFVTRIRQFVTQPELFDTFAVNSRRAVKKLTVSETAKLFAEHIAGVVRADRDRET